MYDSNDMTFGKSNIMKAERDEWLSGIGGGEGRGMKRQSPESF